MGIDQPLTPCPSCGADECSYEHEDEPCYGQIQFETRDGWENGDGSVDEYDFHSCEGHRGSGDFGLPPGARRYKPQAPST